MIKLCRYLGNGLLALGAVLIVSGMIGIYLENGFDAVAEVMSPFNVWQYIAVLITLSPGLFFLWLSKWLRNRNLTSD